MMPVAIGFDLVPGAVRKGLFLAYLLNAADAAKGQREEGTTYEWKNSCVMMFVTIATLIVVTGLNFKLKQTREVGVQVNMDEELSVSMRLMSVAELKLLCVRERVQAGHGATRAAMIALLVSSMSLERNPYKDMKENEVKVPLPPRGGV